MPNEIIETKRFQEALKLKLIHFRTCVVFDLDYTVMAPRPELNGFGGDAWFTGLFAHLAQNNLDEQTALPWLMTLYNAVQYYVRTAPVEPEIVTIINALQDIGVPVLALTARGYSIRKETQRQLVAMGVDFSRNCVLQDDDSSCARGVIYCGGKDKGEKLAAAFAEQDLLPRHVVMFDDKKKHLEHVMKALEQLGVHFTGFRYAYLDQHVKDFDMAKTTDTLVHLGHWLSSVVHESLRNLQLLSDSTQGEYHQDQFAAGFFHPDLHVYTAAEPALHPRNKPLTRSLSTASFFHNSREFREELATHMSRAFA